MHPSDSLLLATCSKNDATTTYISVSVRGFVLEFWLNGSFLELMLTTGFSFGAPSVRETLLVLGDDHTVVDERSRGVGSLSWWLLHRPDGPDPAAVALHQTKRQFPRVCDLWFRRYTL